MPIKISQQQQHMNNDQQQHMNNDQQQHINNYYYQDKNQIENQQSLRQQQHQYPKQQQLELQSQQQKLEQQSQQQQIEQQEQELMLQTIKQQLLQNKIITKQQLQHILSQQQSNFIRKNNLINDNDKNNNTINKLTHKQCLYAIITHLTASIIEHNQHFIQVKQKHHEQIQSIKQTINKNDHFAISALQLFYHLTEVLTTFSQTIYNKKQQPIYHNTNNNNIINNNTPNNQLHRITSSSSIINSKPPIEIYKQFRQVYQITEQLSSLFNKYQFSDQQIIQKRNSFLQKQILNMEQLFINQQQNQSSSLQYQLQSTQQQTITNINKSYPQQQQYPQYSTTNHPHPTNLPTQTSQYILSLRQQITHLHQTLIKNDQQFTHQIQVPFYHINKKNYNKTIRQLTQTIKAYEQQIAKIIHYQLKIQQLEKTIIKFRQDKYKNEIVIQQLFVITKRNMAKKIRNYEKDLKGDHAFISPQRQKLISSPQSKYSMLNSKLSVVNSLNNYNNNNGKSLLQQKQQQNNERNPMPHGDRYKGQSEKYSTMRQNIQTNTANFL